MTDTSSIWLKDAQMTLFAGSSLSNTIYRVPLDILLNGDLGTGKTTFIQGLGSGLKITDKITSPTFALENRYLTLRFGEFIHIDCFRLSAIEAQELAVSSDGHNGIRCIEWSERISPASGIKIEIFLNDSCDSGRNLNILFSDISMPSRDEILTWRKDLLLPGHVSEHCDAVAGFAFNCAEKLLAKGIILRPLALKRSAELHDLFRFLDFGLGVNNQNIKPTPDQKKVWSRWKDKHPAHSHESACGVFLRGKNYPEIASIVELHGLNTENPANMTIEQKLLFYSDKRTRFNRIVSLEERFEDFKIRYAVLRNTDFARKWYGVCKELERELFGDEPPA